MTHERVDTLPTGVADKDHEPHITPYAFIFPGQGSQFFGMGKDLSSIEAAKPVFNDLDRVMGQGFSHKVFTDETGWLNETENTQPALVAISIAFLEVYLDANKERRDITPLAYAGHSVALITALIASGAITRERGLILARERGRLMKLAGEENPGKMGVVNGLSEKEVEGVVEKINGEAGEKVVVIANYNSPQQYVLSGFAGNVEHAMRDAQEKGAIKVDILPVSIASHSPLMIKAAEEFKKFVDETRFTEPRAPIALNSTGKLTTSIDEIQEELWRGPVEPVRWTDIIQEIIAIDPDVRFLEFGPGQVLSKLIKRIDKNVNSSAMNTYQAVSV